MMQDCNVIAKGSYSQFRFNDFVSVRQYLLIREKGKKYLVLKLSNDAKETVTGLKLAVEQLDGRDACIQTSYVEWTDLNGAPGEKFVPNEKIPLRESCVEVRIRLTGATYGNYVCDVKSDELVVTYDKKETKSATDYSANTKGEKSVKQQRKYKVPYILGLASLLVLVCSFVLTMLHLWDFREKQNTFRWKDVHYEFIGEKNEGAPIRIIGYSGTYGDIVIPEEIDGYPVVEVAEEAFFNQDNLYRVEILADVAIGNSAFAQCDELREVVLAGAPTVGKSAFEGCDSLETVTANNVEEIGTRAFKGCRALRELYLCNEKDVLEIGENAFANCAKLDVVVIDQAVDYSTAPAFLANASNITRLELKNYNCALYEGTTDKPLSKLFGGKIPGKLQTLKIADIDAIVPSFCENIKALKEVTLSGFSANNIPAKAFNGCVNLAKLNIAREDDAKPITTIEEYAFNATKIPSFDCSAVENIGKYAFANNAALTDVHTESNEVLCEMGEGAFRNCTSLKSIHVSEILEEIPIYAFENCTSLTSFTINESSALTVIGESAMENCTSLTSIQLPKSVTHVGDRALANCSAMETVGLPGSLKEIGGYAFSGCATLKNVEIPFNIEYIGRGAFANCTALTEYKAPFIGCSATEDNYLGAVFGAESYGDTDVLPESLQTVTINGECDVAEYAFYGIESLKQVYLTGEILNIGEYAFADCTNLRELYLGATIQAIQPKAFLNCRVLFEIWNNTTLNIRRGESSYGGIAQYALAVYGVGETRMDYATANDFICVMTETGWYITDYVGEESEWVLPDVFTSQNEEDVDAYALPAYVFAENEQLKTLEVNLGVTSIGERAFTACPNLETVTATEAKEWGGVESNTFSACPSLTTVTLPSAMQYIDKQAFENSKALQKVTLPANLEVLGEKAFRNCEGLTDIAIPATVHTLGESVFKGASSLETVDLSNTEFTVLPASTFSGCKSLTTVKMDGAKFEHIGEYAFHETALKELALPSGLQTIGACAFSYARLPSLNIEQDLYMICENAFEYADIQTVNISGVVSVMEEGVFYGCDQLTSVNIADFALTEIPAYTFADCTALKDIALGEGITSIKNSAFNGVVATEIITLPSTVKTIGQYAFANNYALSTMILSESLTSIAQNAFTNCDVLYEVYNPSALSITRGSDDYGSVAANAIIVHESLDAERLRTKTQDGITYKYAPTERIACIYEGVEIPKTLTISAVKLDGTTYRNLWVHAYAFNGNDTMEELTLNNVTEIQSYAFGYCTALKKVTLGSALQADKVERNAFIGCEDLWEVYTGSNEQSLTPGGTNFGGVAYYALAINEEIEYKTVGNFDFMYFDDVWRMYQYNGKGNEELPDIDATYQIYKHPMLDSTPFDGVGSGYLVIPNDVTSLSEGVFESLNWNDRLYYKGTAKAWEKLTANVGWYGAYVYYYNDCVHNSYQSTSYWTYKDGKPTTNDSALTEIRTEPTCEGWGLIEWFCEICDEVIDKEDLYPSGHSTTAYVTREPTCQRTGLKEWRCKDCGEVVTTEELSKVNHAFTGTDGACTWCKQQPVSAEDLGDLLKVENESYYKFFIDSDGVVYTDWRADYTSYTSKLVITAQADATVSFTARLVLQGTATARFSLNGESLVVMNATGEEDIEILLSEGDVLSISFNYTDGYGREARLYIEDFVAEEYVKNDQSTSDDSSEDASRQGGN